MSAMLRSLRRPRSGEHVEKLLVRTLPSPAAGELYDREDLQVLHFAALSATTGIRFVAKCYGRRLSRLEADLPDIGKGSRAAMPLPASYRNDRISTGGPCPAVNTPAVGGPSNTAPVSRLVRWASRSASGCVRARPAGRRSGRRCRAGRWSCVTPWELRIGPPLSSRHRSKPVPATASSSIASCLPVRQVAESGSRAWRSRAVATTPALPGARSMASPRKTGRCRAPRSGRADRRGLGCRRCHR